MSDRIMKGDILERCDGQRRRVRVTSWTGDDIYGNDISTDEPFVVSLEALRSGGWRKLVRRQSLRGHVRATAHVMCSKAEILLGGGLDEYAAAAKLLTAASVALSAADGPVRR